MSKAFTSEETIDTSVPGRLPTRAAPGEERPITPAGHRALMEERRRLLDEELPAARAAGLEGEAQVRHAEHRVAVLEATLASVRVVEPARDGRVRFGSRVTLEWENGRRQSLEVVGPDEADPREGRISFDSPLARSLLGREPGDTAEVHRPLGTEEVEIVSVD